MRTISAAQRQTLEDLSAEGLLRQLPLQTAEKDIHITDLLRGLSELVVQHDHFSDLRRGEAMRHDAGIQLVFAGGTCLSKAHGLIDRMSEDIDIKVVLKPTDKPLKRGRGTRVRLVALHDLLPKLLARLDFPLLTYEDEANPRIRDVHRYYVIGAGYESAYPQLPSLRPELKLELIQREPLLPVETREFGYLHESLAGLAPSSKLSIACVSVAETAAEKVLSLLRRCAYQWDGHQTKGEMDPALVRHVYDVACIAAKSPESLAVGKDIFARLVMGDQAEFRNQNPEFDADPVAVLKRTLIVARSHAELRQRYVDTLLPLVYETQPPTFEQAFAAFETVAQDYLSAC
ncbi:nucleotidyl transferase AbiEii/AbiGii toxin family protein [Verminephrobacter eiseniae]|uniref:nucleotidyl transferase AbiEii/AbiGii toxin family protein n=1 Tax=Verminephrobacter eiseniae TaxID=364317 RepID=UPI00223797C3|nr:nucleotidyl transferase AbiEii/AbiGii toxin family protein [Verminephrobacter eiseniae]MCW5230479.1 nucleotidyl transferase AbiEii/AbiGii toxin family protein [Verminephrobacter eiseniae]MCW5292212.1 nucleotidyl transferase AbiEii/AbiGii toxin family protein [Verminephrobacter eiseniae]MCW8184373.1 nucleotidyl transferase AbiEii/AbiGii toxin family protein [Verminephrobacter eiseniae]MCW8223181.1 nucleotidyl transferase AbiEii/AbiGii toxin family protein [Verminephrobacter eiseniae]MCW82347